MTALTAERAAVIVADVGPGRELGAAIMSPMAGVSPVKLASLAAVDRFLKPVSAEQIFATGPRVKVSHVDPRSLAVWVRDVVGDADLADALDQVVATDAAYGKLVPEFKRLIGERLEACQEVLTAADEAAE